MTRRRRSFLSRVRVVLHSGSPVTKWVLLGMVVVCTVVLIAIGVANGLEKKEAEKIRQQAIVLEQENAKLAAKIAELGSVQSIVRIAREELGMEDPDTVIIQAPSATEAKETGGSK